MSRRAQLSREPYRLPAFLPARKTFRRHALMALPERVRSLREVWRLCSQVSCLIDIPPHPW